MGIDVEELRDDVLIPAARAAPPSMPRVVGPGRLERSYRARIVCLEDETTEQARALECAALVERGQTRLLDRLESEVERGRTHAQELEQREKRLILCLGALQRENELLRASSAAQRRLKSSRVPSERVTWRRRIATWIAGREA